MCFPQSAADYREACLVLTYVFDNVEVTGTIMYSVRHFDDARPMFTLTFRNIFLPFTFDIFNFLSVFLAV
jgi:hypothetical protein